MSALFSTQTPPDDWPDAIGLVANKYTKLGKTSENLILSLGLSYLHKNLSVIAQEMRKRRMIFFEENTTKTTCKYLLCLNY
jgi:hypothetical protein